MARYNNFPEVHSPPEPFESALRVGKVRVRPYKSGSVKHAHVVLKKVDEEVYEDSLGRKLTRGVFSLFAQKVINCKPGKEIFFAVDDYLQERVVAFEADLRSPEDTNNDVLNCAKSDETLVQREAQSHSLPPKMRKMWAKRESVAVKQGIPNPSVKEKASIGVQAYPIPASIGVQTSPVSISDEHVLPSVLPSSEEPPPLLSTADMQTETVSLKNLAQPPDGPSTQSCLQSRGHSGLMSPDLLTTTAEDFRTKVDLPAETDSRSGSCERSLSPMELESVSSSPRSTPRLLVREMPLTESNGDDSACEKLVESAGTSQAESAATLVETILEKVKEEPEDIALPPSPVPKPRQASRSFRAPVFVPARHNPFQQKMDVSNASVSLSSTPAQVQTAIRPMISTTPTPLTVLKQAVSATPVLTSPFLGPSTAHPVPVPYVEDSSLQSPETGAVTGTSQGSTRPAPTFVPATQLSQSSQISLVEVHPTPVSPGSFPMASTHRYEPATPLMESSIRESTASRKRKRMDPDMIVPPTPNTQADVVGAPSKKWKPIVKEEPRSPVLSSIMIPEPDSARLGHARPPPLSLSIPPFVPTVTPSSVSSQLEHRQTASAVIKTEAMDYVPPSFDSQMSRPSPISLSHHGLRSYIDLTSPRAYRAPLSAPVKRFNKPRRRTNGICSSLPIVKTAQIKMDSGGRDAVGVRAIVFDPVGDRFAVICRDNSIRIWDNTSFVEIAKLAHSSSVISAVWMDGDISIASMGSNGVVSRWSLVGKNKWMWEKLIDSGDTEPSCFAYYRHLIAVASTRRGVRIWECRNGYWMPLEREISRRDVLSIKFINGGAELLCACSDGNLLQYSIQKCKIQPVTRLKTKVFYVDADPANTHALVAQALGSAHLIDIAPMDERGFGRIVQDYSLRDVEQQYGARGVHGFKPILTDYGDAVIFGSIEGRVLVWDRRRGQVIHEMDHGCDVLVQAVASFDGGNGEQHLVSCTKYGLLTWWRLPIRLF